MEILYTLLLNGLPVLILAVPLLFLWKKTIGKLYFRIVIGILVFYLIYWILPIIFQIGVEPNRLTVPESEEGNIALGLGYLATHFMSLIMYFVLYPMVTLPFIFFVAPFISLIFIRTRLSKEEGTIKENLTQLTYEYEMSPFQKIKKELTEGNWSREKEILKLMVVLLPISLYLLQVILDISNLQTVSLTEGTTALGWFLEILFVYLAVFIFSIELLFSSQIALKGRYFGEKIREQTYKSLYQVGAPISILSLILFVVQYTQSIGIIVYFFAYFIMASIIFILFIDIFEPIAILLLLKLVDWWKNKDIKKKERDYSSLFYVAFFSLIGLIIFFAINMVVGLILYPIIGESEVLNEALYTYDNPSLIDSLGVDLANIISSGAIMGTTILIALIIAYGLKQLKNLTLGLAVFLPVLIIISIIMNIPDEYWITGQVSYTDVLGVDFYTLRTAMFKTDFYEEGNYVLLGIALPYLYSRYIVNVFFWGLILFYLRKEFKIKNIPIDDKHLKKTVFTTLDEFITSEDYIQKQTDILVSKTESPKIMAPEQQKAEVQSLLAQLDEERVLKELIPKDSEDMRKLYYTLKYLFDTRQISLWNAEFSFIFERGEKQGLYIIYTDGRDVYNYAFTEGSSQDPALISGMFSAISSFIKETTQSTQLLRNIDHGDITILIEYGKYIFAALFMKGKASSEVRSQVKKFVEEFEEKHKNVLDDWNGSLQEFNDDDLLVDKIFIEE